MTNQIENQQLRTFGLMVGGIFALIGLWPTLFDRADPRLWALVLTGLLVIPALLVPRILGPIYRVWMTIGHALGWVNTRIILSLMLYGIFTPIGLFRRFVLGKDSMQRRFEPEVNTYRVLRQPRPGSHMKRQF